MQTIEQPMNCLFKAKAWLKYQLKAHYRKGHHVHSPYTYRLFTNVFFERWQYYSFPQIERIRGKMPNNEKAKKSDRPKYTQLLQRLCATNNAKNIIEIGRSNGISTLYLSSNDSKSTVYSVSNNKTIDIFKTTGHKNIVQCKSDELQRTLNKIDFIDMLYVRRSCGVNEIETLFNICKSKSHDDSIFIFDDIHADKETEEKWRRILESDDITLSIDIFRMGLVWFKKDLKKQHYTVKY